MHAIPEKQWQELPEIAQQMLYDFYCFVKTRYSKQETTETQVFSEHTANLIAEWQDPSEDEIWK